jgi:hypothetical protein
MGDGKFIGGVLNGKSNHLKKIWKKEVTLTFPSSALKYFLIAQGLQWT